MPLMPKLLEYENTQFLLIGHNEGALEKATARQAGDVEQDKEAPKEEMERLEHEDDLRVEHLKGTVILLQATHRTDPVPQATILSLKIWA